MNSMTGFGSAHATSELGSVSIEIRSVNSRYLDLQFRLPDELRLAEMPLRQLLANTIIRGKVEIRGSYARAQKDLTHALSESVLAQIDATHQHIKARLPDLAAPTFADILSFSDAGKAPSDPQQWVELCMQAGKQAVEKLIETRQREGQRLVAVIAEQARELLDAVQGLKSGLPEIMAAQSEKLAMRLREAFDQACPNGLTHISGAEISERLAAQAGLFSLRADVAEELDRLTLHTNELQETIGAAVENHDQAGLKKGIGKRLDFLFQEMNREANTLGSKAVHIDLTRTAIDLKLLIEQMREQIQNIE